MSGTSGITRRQREDCAAAFDVAPISLALCLLWRAARTSDSGVHIRGAGEAGTRTHNCPRGAAVVGGGGRRTGDAVELPSQIRTRGGSAGTGVGAAAAGDRRRRT